MAQDALSTSRALLTRLTAGYGPRDFAVRFWGADTWPAEGPDRFTLVLNHPGALRRMFLPPGRLSIGEAFIFGDYDLEGDAEAFFDLLAFWADRRRGPAEKFALWRLLRTLPADGRERMKRAADLTGAVHSPDRDRQAIRYHYDISNAFYALWLDERMVYSCGYFTRPDEDLAAAQLNKLDHTCRKLRLEPGQRLLDIGCGWGGLIRHAAQNYGVSAVGITLSERQKEYADAAIRRDGLADRCRVDLVDYRSATGEYDRVVSVGMAEHVGTTMLPTYFGHAWRLLKPGGVMLNHAIGLAGAFKMPAGGFPFVKRYVFPDGDLVPIHDTLQAAAAAGFEVRDVESLREHYVLTLRHWRQRLLARAAEARQLTSDVTARIWDYYMAGSAYGFRTAKVSIYQTLLLKQPGGPARLPLTRADWYAGVGPLPAESRTAVDLEGG